MLLHIRPRLYSPFRNVSLIDLDIKPLGIHLQAGVDLATRRPYPNKHYAVACRKQGHKAIDGILIETATAIGELVYSARWAIEATFCVTHHVDYRILDHDFDAASDSVVLWHACCEDLGGWSSRFPAGREGVAPVVAEPMMEVVPRDFDCRRVSEDVVEDEWIVSRREIFAMPTIERERILNTRINDRMPSVNSAFRLS